MSIEFFSCGSMRQYGTKGDQHVGTSILCAFLCMLPHLPCERIKKEKELRYVLVDMIQIHITELYKYQFLPSITGRCIICLQYLLRNPYYSRPAIFVCFCAIFNSVLVFIFDFTVGAHLIPLLWFLIPVFT